MRKILFSLSITVFLISAAMILTQCDIILGSGKNANVSIYLGNFPGAGTSRDIGTTQKFSSVKVTVTGPGMTTITQTDTSHAVAISLSVPAGTDRHFTVEAFLQAPLVSPLDKYPHLVSLKGRASADLVAGQAKTVTIKMVAGATQLLVPDNWNRTIFWADDITSFSSGQSGDLGFANAYPTGYDYLRPSDLDIASNGIVFVAHDDYSNGIVFADTIFGNSGVYTPYTPLPYQYVNALTMDRDANYDIDKNGTVDTCILYFYSTYPSGQLNYLVIDGAPPYTTTVQSLDISATYMTPRGMAIDPWTHHLYLVGTVSGATTFEGIIEFDPFTSTVVRTQSISTDNYLTLQDVIVKDDAIFVLNSVNTSTPNPPGKSYPVVLKYDKNLGFINGYGTLSYDPGGTSWDLFIESYSAGDFYQPMRFFAQENDGLYIIDDAMTFDKVVYIDTDFNNWKTFPASGPYSTTGFFSFFNIPPS